MTLPKMASPITSNDARVNHGGRCGIYGPVRRLVGAAMTAAVLGLGAGCGAEAMSADMASPGPVGGKGDDLLEGACEQTCVAFVACVGEGGGAHACAEANMCEDGISPCETQAQAEARKGIVAERRGRPRVMLHRGAWGFASENTLEAYRATFEVGADGNEIDVRLTSDGALVMFHDDFLDGKTKAYGDLGELDLVDVHDLHLRDPGPFGAHARVPSFAEALDLHRRYAGLVHLDLKVPGTDEEVAAMLDVLDMWSHVTEANDNGGNAAAVRGRPEYAAHAMGGMIGLTDRRGDFDRARIDDAVARVGAQGGLFVDDPRLALRALGRDVSAPSSDPIDATPSLPAPLPTVDETQLLAVLSDTADWDDVPATAQARADKAVRIRARFEAALAVAEQHLVTPQLHAALTQLALHRSLHPDWRHHGVDGAEAITSLLRLGDLADCGAPEGPRCVVDVARTVLEDEGADLAALDGVSEVGASDWRIKAATLRALAHRSSPEVLQLLLDVLSWNDDELARRGPIDVEQAAASLIAVLPAAAVDDDDATDLALALLGDPRPEVAGRAGWQLLSRSAEPWAQAALATGAPHLLER